MKQQIDTIKMSEYMTEFDDKTEYIEDEIFKNKVEFQHKFL